MKNEAQNPLTARIVVEHHDHSGVQATIDGDPQRFPDLQTLFRAAAERLDRTTTLERNEP